MWIQPAFVLLLGLLQAVLAYEDVAEEARKLGAKISDAVSYPHDFPDTGVGMKAIRAIGAGELLFHMPIRACVSALNLARQNPQMGRSLKDLDAFHALTATLLYELSLGNQSLHAVYLSRLDKATVQLPKFWSPEELAQLQDDDVIEYFIHQQQQVQQGFHVIRLALRHHGNGALADALTYAQYEWASAIVQTRSFMGPKQTSSLIPMADLLNSRPYGYVRWQMEARAGRPSLSASRGYRFDTFPGTARDFGFPAGSQLYNYYGGGDDNRHTLGEYGYVPFPNPDNYEMLLVSDAAAAGGDGAAAWRRTQQYGDHEPPQFAEGVRLTAKVARRQLMRFFRAMVGGGGSGFSVQHEERAAARCVEVLRGKLASRATSIVEDYALLHRSSTEHKLRMAVMYRLDSKTLLLRNVNVCERVKQDVLPRLRLLSHGHPLRSWARYAAALEQQLG